MNIDVHAVGTHRAKLGESPVWSGRDSTLYWVDIDGMTIQALSWGQDEPQVWNMPSRPTCVALTADPDRFVVGMGAGLIEYHAATGQWSELLALETTEGVRMNDGRPDAAGRMWIGSMDERDDDAVGFPGGHLFRVDCDGHADALVDNVATSNGLAFSPDQRTMYWTDTAQQLIWEFDYNVETGAAVNRRIFFDATSLPGKPDGACIDADGGYWLACVYGWTVVRITPNGRLDRTIELPVEKPSMPAFAGPGLDTLVVTSISTGGRRPAAPGQPEAGALLALDVGVTGVPEPMCAITV